MSQTRAAIEAQAADLFPVRWTVFGGIEDNRLGDFNAKARTAIAMAKRYPHHAADQIALARLYAAACRLRCAHRCRAHRFLGRCVVSPRLGGK